MSDVSDKLREIAEKYDALRDDRDQRAEQNGKDSTTIADLQAQLAAFQPKPELKPRIILFDNFQGLPIDVEQGGPYVIDAQPAAFTLKSGLVVKCFAQGRLDANGTRRRCELGILDPGSKRNYRRDPYGKCFIYSAALRFPMQSFEDTAKVVCLQHHGGPADPGDKENRNPPLSLEFWGKSGTLQWVQAPFEATPRKTLWKLEGGVDHQRWYAFIVRAVWDGTGTSKGELTISLDGNIIHHAVGKNAYSDKAAYTFFKAGVYWPAATENPELYKEEHFREVHFQSLKIEEV
jgi:hypothetical protein